MVANGEGGATAGWGRETIVGCGLHEDETLQAARLSEALHCSLSFSKWQIAVFNAVIEPLVGPMIEAG